MFTPEVKTKILTLMEKNRCNRFTVDYDDSDMMIMGDSVFEQ